MSRIVKTTYLIGLGSNLGDRAAYIAQALNALRAHGDVDAVSPVVSSPAWGSDSCHHYLNACARFTWAGSPADTWALIEATEHAAGRVRSVPNADRTLDMDILWWSEGIHLRDGLTIPHPQLHRRDFVLHGVQAVAPQAVHPVLGRSFAAIHAPRSTIHTAS